MLTKCAEIQETRYKQLINSQILHQMSPRADMVGFEAFLSPFFELKLKFEVKFDAQHLLKRP